MLTKDELIEFEQDIANEFNAGHIRAPVHLENGNEEKLIEIFSDVATNDWICCSWRSHYKCLLKGVPPDELKAAIMAGKSISLCFPTHKIISSAIVGGILPIALGIALAMKRQRKPDRVWCFMGDMTAQTGMAHECVKYAVGFGLPIEFIIEDNGLSVCTDTKAVWGEQHDRTTTIEHFTYSSIYPHAGAGVRVQF